MEITTSVRGLVEFILRSGDIDNSKAVSPENAMQEGGRIHRMIQRRMGAEYHPEVSLRYAYATPAYDIIIEGRADGIIFQPIGDSDQMLEITDHTIPEALRDNFTVTIDEIKGTYKDLEKMKEPQPLHLAQAKCYAFIYANQNNLRSIHVRMTYCHMETEEIRMFHFEYEYEEIERWFLDLMSQYIKWADYSYEWNLKRKESIKNLDFPFEYREGQRDLVAGVYRTIFHKKKLFIEAPTGVGKTIATVFPSVKALGEDLAEKIFYLTAKTITRTVAEEAFLTLREGGLSFKTVTLTAKEKICFAEEVDCNPTNCPYAKGHFDRVNDAMYDLLTHENSFDREIIEEYARKYMVCPFEFCLDMSLFADAVICDYNYAFDPHVYLRRFFAEGAGRNYIFLIDEAHNLVDRGREMYSATLRKEDFLALKKDVKPYSPKIEKQLEKCNKIMLAHKKACIGEYKIEDSVDDLIYVLNRLSTLIDDYLDDHEDSAIKKDLLSFYFEVSHFLQMNELVDDNYVIYSKMQEDGSYIIKEYCVNPSVNLKNSMMRARSSILFSATLLPIQYYKSLLGGTDEDYEIYAHSVFDPAKRGLFIANDVTSKYTRRSITEYRAISSYIKEIVSARKGNYMVFFPSHQFLSEVYDCFTDEFFDENAEEIVVQSDYMKEEERERFLRRFSDSSCDDDADDIFGLINMEVEIEEDKTLIGFCVLGGIFAEGIDLKNDRLIGSIIVGTGLPQVCTEREILKNHFDEDGLDGFDYAYRYPGMNKVFQAAGRVIRTADDVGVVALLDERFLQTRNKQLFPREWHGYKSCNRDGIGRLAAQFWNEAKLTDIDTTS